ncbi:neurexin-1-like [Tubulanus polymorphus]|uniref:neurexin-1-like n=1 Tax=Tubulanus polymorphus TaxID=672921 RepID=UPI003DA24B58
MLSSNVMTVGGSVNTAGLPGATVRNNFKGCLKKVMYTADSLQFDITMLAEKKHDLIQTHGDIQFNTCVEQIIAQPITFTTPESYIKLTPWEASYSGTIEFRFRTNEPNCLLMYNSGAESLSDFFAMEILDGYLFVILDLGSGTVKVKASKGIVNNGMSHHIHLSHSGRRGTVLVDGDEVIYRTKGNNDRLDLGGYMFVGGVDDKSEAYTIPHSVWAAVLKNGYVGCIEDLVINGDKVDLALHARQQNVNAVVEYCRSMEPQCQSKTCKNKGVCAEGWNRFICDCSLTAYTGEACEKGI